jgi:hypothetical protein
VLKTGRVALTLDGQPVEGDLPLSDISDILAWHKTKGELIPLDCEHLLQKLADKLGVSEADLIKTRPILGEKAAAGFLALRAEGQEIWADVKKLSARARELFTGAGDLLYGYHSVVLRGLKTPPLRVTSISLTNNPAVNDQDLLAATAEAQACPDLPRATMLNVDDGNRKGDRPVAPTRSEPMKLDALKKLAGLLGIDAAALTADGAGVDALIDNAVSEIETARAGVASFLANLKGPLALADTDVKLDAIAGKILSAIEKGKNDSVALTAIQARVADLEAKERDRFVESLRTEGKLTDAMLPWAKKQDTAALTDWAKTAPVVVQQNRLVAAGAAATGDDGLTLTEADRAVAKLCGHTAEEVAKANGLKV